MPVRPNTPLPLLGGLVAVLIGGATALHLLNRTTPANEQPAAANHTESAPHAGNVQSFGNSHVEAQTTRSGQLTLLFYGIKDKDLLPIDIDPPIEAQSIATGEDSRPIALTPKPYPGEPKGTASRFIGEIAGFQPGQTGLTLVIPFQGRNYRVQWTATALAPGAAAGADTAMPSALGSAEAQKLFLTPGGLYTQADIEANGSTTATARYGNQMSAHNSHPKPGDAICPISETAANPKFAWIVGGKRYTFCCPPCIEEFVRKAKETPEKIKQPEAYIQP
ncbi:MAG: hypothetical protein QM758_02705 [Armatimonas sp.]